MIVSSCTFPAVVEAPTAAAAPVSAAAPVLPEGIAANLQDSIEDEFGGTGNTEQYEMSSSALADTPSGIDYLAYVSSATTRKRKHEDHQAQVLDEQIRHLSQSLHDLQGHLHKANRRDSLHLKIEIGRKLQKPEAEIAALEEELWNSF